MRTILVIDDNAGVAAALKLLFGLHEIETRWAATPHEGLNALEDGQVDLVIADMNFASDTTSGAEGAALFHAIRGRYPDLPVILLTAWVHLEAAVQLVKAGAADYIAKPWDNSKLLASAENLLELSEATRERHRLQRERQSRRGRLAASYDLQGMVFESWAMQSAIELACRVAHSPVPILVTGASGVGKECIAALVHANSAVRDGPFVAVNCGALPAELMEAELFGAEQGAYTGANRSRPGRFELADNGTLFLDEIGNLPLAGQAKLLRVLETGQFEPLGSSQPRNARVRLVSATNADLRSMIREGRFREDLFYRLNVIDIAVPPLSERLDDIMPLAEHFLGSEFTLTEQARRALLQYHWPGNVRELRNAIERAKLLASDAVVHAAHLNLTLLPHEAGGREGRDVDSLTCESIAEGLRAAGGNVTRAAQRLGLSRQALYRRMQRFGLRS